MNLLEQYKGRLAVSEKYFAQSNGGAKMDASRKMLTAQCLDNVARFINESFANSVGTQRSDLGVFKKFCLDITTLTVPNLIVNDLFIAQPMASYTGFLTYMNFGLGTEVGELGGYTKDEHGEVTGLKTVTQDPFVWAPMTEARSAYTGRDIVETVSQANANYVLAFKPTDKDGKVTFIAEGSTEKQTLTPTEGKYNVPSAGRLIYSYDNETVPQAKLPTMVGRMQGITLTAKARRIAVQYSQFAAFQSKQDYGIDFESTIAQQAQAELQYEIDSEAVFMIAEAAKKHNAVVKWVDEELDTVSYSMKAEGFARSIEKAKAMVYRNTGRYMPNWMLVSPDVMPILTFVPGFQAANNSVANGPSLVY